MYDAEPCIQAASCFHAGRARMDEGKASALVEREGAFKPEPTARFKATRRRRTCAWKKGRSLPGRIQSKNGRAVSLGDTGHRRRDPALFHCNRLNEARHCTSPRLAHRPPHPPTRSARLPRAASPSSHHSTRAARASPRTSRSRTPCPHRRHALSDRHDNPPPRRERQQALALRAATPRFPLLHNR